MRLGWGGRRRGGSDFRFIVKQTGALVSFVVVVNCLVMITRDDSHAQDARPAVEGATASEVPVTTDADKLSGMTWKHYKDAVRSLAAIRAFVPLSRLATGENEGIVGLNVVIPVGEAKNIRNVSWELIPRGQDAPLLFVDENGSGILEDDSPIPLLDLGGGLYEGVEKISFAAVPSGQESYTVRWTVQREGGGWNVTRYPWRERRGVISVAGDEYKFSLRTRLPTYAGPGSLMAIDLNRDGTVELQEGGLETFEADGTEVPIGGEAYVASVHPRGDSLRLLATGRKAAPRATLAIGSKAPSIPSGLPFAISKGRPLLMNFWSPHCSFSKRMAPQLEEAHKANPAVQFLNITNAEGAAAEKATAEFRQEWPAVVGAEGKDLFALYRVSAIPTYYIVDSKGVIRATGSTLEWTRLVEVLSTLATESRGDSKR